MHKNVSIFGGVHLKMRDVDNLLERSGDHCSLLTMKWDVPVANSVTGIAYSLNVASACMANSRMNANGELGRT
jgi:hypothetical protein